MAGGGAIVEFNRDSGWDSIHVGPDEEATRALVLILRLFMQDNDSISMRNMSTLYATLPISIAVRQEFDAHRARLNALLDSESNLAIEEDRLLSHRDILEIFVYGEYAHVRETKRQTYEDIRSTPFFPLFQKTLVRTIVEFGRAISAVQRTNRRAIEDLAASGL